MTGGFDVNNSCLMELSFCRPLLCTWCCLKFTANQRLEEMINVNVQKIYYQLVVGKQQEEASVDTNGGGFEKSC
jgi:hypothetical protein